MKTSTRLLTLIALSASLLGGCAIVPAPHGAYYRQPNVYVETYPAYRAPPPSIYPAPRYYGRGEAWGERHRDRW